MKGYCSHRNDVKNTRNKAFQRHTNGLYIYLIYKLILIGVNAMKKTTFARTTLATLITLSLTACGGHSYDGGKTAQKPSEGKPQPTQQNDKLKKDLETANKKVETATKAKEEAIKAKVAADKKVGELNAEIDKLKKAGKDTKALEKQLNVAKNEAAAANKAKDDAVAKADAANKAKDDAVAKADTANKAKDDAVAKADAANKAKKDAEDKLKTSEQAKKDALADKEKAEKAKKDALADKKKTEEKVKELEKEIEDLKAKGGDTKDLEEKLKTAEKAKKDAEDKLKTAEKAKKDAEDKLKTAEKAKKTTEEKLKDFERVEEYQDGTVAYKAEVPMVEAADGTPRKKYQDALDKYDMKKIFDLPTTINATDNALGTAGSIKIDVDGTETSVSVDRHDLEYSSIATMTAQINTFQQPDYWTGELKWQTAGSTVLAVTGKPTDLTKVSFDELKAQNKGNLIYEGRALYAVHKKELLGEKPYPDNTELADSPEKYDIMFSENSWAKPTFKVNLETAKISGKMEFGSTNPLKITLAETDIVEQGNQLQFAGVVNATQETTKIEQKNGQDVVLRSDHVLKEGTTGKYNGAFMGPNAEELAGKFLIEQDYKRDDAKISKWYDAVPGRYTQFGNIQGVFNAKKVKVAADQTYNKDTIVK